MLNENLSCAEVTGRLPALVAGEDGSPTLREHVARCDACRAERDRLAHAVERLRVGLATLSPSPFLADEVAKVASASEVTALRTSRRHLWAGAGIAVVAASILFAVLATVRGGAGRGAGAEDGDVVAWIAPPPTARVVEEARRANHVSIPEGDPAWPLDGMLHEDGATRTSDRFLPPREGTVHRWVYADKDAVAGKRTLSMGTCAREGVMLLGMGLLHHVGKSTISFDETDRSIRVDAEGKIWKGLPGTAEAELVVSAPYEGGPEARVRVLVSTAYSGSLLLDEPLARALDLGYFEIPGGFEIEEAEIRGQRARARIRIAELGVDVVTEVQVVEPGEAAIQGSASVRPERIGVERTSDQVMVRFRGGPHSVIASGVLVRGDAPSPTGEARSPDKSTVALAERFDPGTALLVARVWRGREAIPSREGVSVARAGPDGRMAFPRFAGEAGSTLRALVIPPSGEPTFRDVDLDAVAEGTVQAVLRKDGLSLSLVTSVGGGGEQTTWGSGGQPLTADVVNMWVRRTLERWVGSAGLHRGGGVSAVHLIVRAEPDVPWGAVQGLLMSGLPGGIRRVSFAPAGRVPRVPDTPVLGPLFDRDLIRQDLPGDTGPAPVPEPVAVRVSLTLPDPAAPPKVRVNGTPVGHGDLEGALKDAVRDAAVPRGAKVVGVLGAPPPTGGGVPYEEVFRVLRLMRDAGIDDVRFEAPALSPTPK